SRRTIRMAVDEPIQGAVGTITDASVPAGRTSPAGIRVAVIGRTGRGELQRPTCGAIDPRGGRPDLRRGDDALPRPSTLRSTHHGPRLRLALHDRDRLRDYDDRGTRNRKGPPGSPTDPLEHRTRRGCDLPACA